ncbi:MAG: hypothetical protein ACYSWQ_27155 [Planctomycetota bacterium]
MPRSREARNKANQSQLSAFSLSVVAWANLWAWVIIEGKMPSARADGTSATQNKANFARAKSA